MLKRLWRMLTWLEIHDDGHMMAGKKRFPDYLEMLWMIPFMGIILVLAIILTPLIEVAGGASPISILRARRGYHTIPFP